MLKSVIYLASILSLVLANGEFSILSSPSSLEFKGHENLESSDVSEVFAAALGYSVEQPSGWTGLYVKEPFNLPKTVVAVVVEGVDKISVQQGKNPSYTLSGSSASYSINQFASVVEQHGKVLDLNLNGGYDSLTPYTNIFGDVKPAATPKSTSLKPQLFPEDKLFLQQLSIMNLIGDKLASTAEVKPALIIIRISMGGLIEAHKAGSPAVADAMKMLSASVQKLAETIEESYKNDVLVTVIASKEDSRRSKRDVSESTIPSTINLAKNYSSDYPVIFNIMLWFGVAFFFSLMAICMTIATMDPGRDSIIYRMTLNRLKKEN